MKISVDVILKEYDLALLDKDYDRISIFVEDTKKLDRISSYINKLTKGTVLRAISSKEFEKKIEDNLIAAYKRIRSNVRNGLAIVPIERNASGGSYFTIPPQIQMEIASRQKIITDEYSGRILVDAELANEEKDKINKLINSL